MNIKVYTLSTCSTSKKILKELSLDKKNCILQDIKFDKISSVQLDKMKELSGSYQSLFSKRAQKYKQLNLKNKELAEDDYRNLILQEYTFLKRPVVIVDKQIFIGNSKNNIAKLKAILL